MEPTHDRVAPPPNRTLTLPCPHVYARVAVAFAEHDAAVTEALLRAMIAAALRGLFGAVGGALPFELLHFRASDGAGIVRVPAPDFPRLQAALTCLTEYDGHECRLLLHSSAPFLSSLAADSRRFALGLSLD
jgi:ribonuclease P protein subunit RPP14